jgi:hypothetical protein
MPSYLPTAAELAAMTVALVASYEADRGKEVTRFRLARRSLRRMAIRSQLRDAVVDDWIDSLATLYGWSTSVAGDEFLLVRTASTKGWTRLGTARLQKMIEALRKGDRSPLDAFDDQAVIDDDDQPDNDFELKPKPIKRLTKPGG